MYLYSASKLQGADKPYQPKEFTVDDVVQAAIPIWDETLSANLTKRFQRKVVLLPGSGNRVTNTLIDSVQPDLRPKVLDAVTRCHPLIDAVHTAFSQHRPLTISPDGIWLVIAQGFTHHIAENAERLRDRLVRHQGKVELSEKVNELSLEAFEQAIAGFSSQIRNASDPVLHETLLCDFSTTTPSIRTASEVVLMDTYSSYFEYLLHCICGIPKIAITGSVEDWQRIRARIEVLETYDLGWWVARLRPIIDEFIRSVMGQPAREFWQAIYKPKRAYGEHRVTGWIADLFPYLNDAPNRSRNHVLNYERQNWEIPVDKGVESWNRMFEPGADKGVGPSSFPSGLSSVPIKLKLPDTRLLELDLVAGFLAVEQAENLALSPVIGWCVTERRPTKPIWI